METVETIIPEDAKTQDPARVEEVLKKAEEGLSTTKAELLAGKYKTKDDLIKGLMNAVSKIEDSAAVENLYKLAEKHLGGKAPESEVKETRPEEAQPKESKPDNDSEDEPDYSFIAEEFQRDGKLSDKSYKALSELGYDRETVDTYLDGIRYRAQQLFSRVGGEENYRAMIEWGLKNLSEAEQEAFDKALSASEAERTLALDGLYRRFMDAKGPKFIRPSAADSGSGGHGGFRSRAEFLSAMKDPRYETDPAYREYIMERLRATNSFS